LGSPNLDASLAGTNEFERGETVISQSTKIPVNVSSAGRSYTLLGMWS
jgi:hypothetical protein